MDSNEIFGISEYKAFYHTPEETHYQKSKRSDKMTHERRHNYHRHHHQNHDNRKKHKKHIHGKNDQLNNEIENDDSRWKFFVL